MASELSAADLRSVADGKPAVEVNGVGIGCMNAASYGCRSSQEWLSETDRSCVPVVGSGGNE